MGARAIAQPSLLHHGGARSKRSAAMGTHGERNQLELVGRGTHLNKSIFGRAKGMLR